MITVEKTARTVEEAVQSALEELEAEKDNVDIEILEQPTKGIFGILGSKNAKVRVTLKEKKTTEKSVNREIENKEIRITEYTLEKERARKFLRDVLEAMDIKAEIRVKDINESLYINLSGPKMGMIIGRRGQTLDSLQYLVSLVVNKDKERDSFVKVILDTEDYRRKREETLQRLARRLADRARKTGKNIELEPMNPYERRIIHSTLQEVEGITTFSEGEEPYRKVIISNK
ncbi:MAG TPA: RNA-binding cell elongation regulator Jag/EloR [Bacillota bacterium]|jgi:spoIIIJ-associated protein|nr:RNA-binding cell elongation regulator Jag/EloR [Bacillota bacterium]HQE65453.1 RNA-binding cell elongation regulator Jag/EloR [Bacillota bacterium]HQI16907.1 RNA-binding cell elongation regulator Jag/EloR [Bacillota bacterium]HQJ37148.1 RNA-binding cell elongation regulator Jag/EloR [Bacillota bacterium]HQL37115.1 RNA-binding cell elongation regulator Jag/EloR [Bacillota bacterium]